MNLKKLSKILGFDFHVSRVLLLRLWNVLAGLILIILIPFTLNEYEQGYYYTFLSIIALQVFFELGMNQIIIQFVGHEFAHLTLVDDHYLTGPNKHIERLASLFQLLLKWYLVIALIFLVAVGCIGIYFFQSNELSADINWQSPWIVLIFFTSCNLIMTTLLGVLEGLGKIGQVAQLRFLQSFIGYTCMWFALSNGFGLISASIVPAISVIVTAVWISKKAKILFFLKSFTINEDSERISWVKDIFPFQWRIAVSWISGYLSLQVITPLIFASQGPIEAGKIGMAITIFSTLTVVSLSWVSAKLPVFAEYIALKKRKKLNELFFFSYIRTVAFMIVASCSLLIVIYFIQGYDSFISNRIAPLNVFIYLAIGSLANSFVFSAAIYMRAHKEEPMMYLSIVCGLLTVIAVYFASQQSSLLVMQFYALIILIVSLPWSLKLFLNYYKRP